MLKAKFERGPEYKAWIRTLPCLLAWVAGGCEGRIEAAHLQRGGMGIKGSDASCIPLCGMRHHKQLDANLLDDATLALLWTKAWELRERWHATAV